jgi:hypothetical protein
MPRITLYNSHAAVLSDGNPVADVDRWPALLTDADSEEDSGRTAAVRLIGTDTDIRFVSYEFFVELTDPGDIVAIRWFQEFYSDFASSFTTPVTNNLLAYRAGTFPTAGFAVWMRETDVINGGLGNVDVHPVTRRMSLVPAPFPPPGTAKPHQVSAHIPLSVHANWARLAFWIDYEASAITNPEELGLYISAHVGGHTEFEYLIARPGVPYVYNAYTGRPLPQGAKIIKRGQG